MPPAGRSSSTSATAGGRSPRSWRPRRRRSPTPTAPPSRTSRSRRTPARSDPACRSTTRRSTRSAAARRRSRPPSSSSVPTTSPAATPDRLVVIARWGSYHGNTLGALDLSGRRPLRRPYEPWLGRFRHVSAAYPYRADDPGANALATAEDLALELERTIDQAGPRAVAAFVAEPIVGATLAAAVPPDGYWPAIAEVCRRHGVLLVADEVMTGFGRTGRWFGLDHWAHAAGHRRRGEGRRRAATGRSGSWPHPGASPTTVARRRWLHPWLHVQPPRRRRRGRPRGAPDPRGGVARRGERVRRASGCSRSSRERLGDHPNVGEIRGRGLMVGVELVADRETRGAVPALDQGHRVDRPGGPRGGPAPLQRDRPRERDRRRLDPPRPAIRRDRRRATRDRRRPGGGGPGGHRPGGLTVLIDLSHEIHDGLVTYPGIPAPVISEVLGRAASRERYAPGTEFLIGSIQLAGNTGTYLDTPFHRYVDGCARAAWCRRRSPRRGTRRGSGGPTTAGARCTTGGCSPASRRSGATATRGGSARGRRGPPRSPARPARPSS